MGVDAHGIWNVRSQVRVRERRRGRNGLKWTREEECERVVNGGRGSGSSFTWRPRDAGTPPLSPGC